MNFSLRPEEQAAFALRSLYQRCGYQQYTVSKFEEYDLYAQNKNFLSSKQILTFSDTNGRLMALKPDITLSIVKNTRDDHRTRKLWYTEKVYRVPRNAYGFQEITQTGLEYIGPIDRYAMSEVLILAARSLETISPRYVLELSHMGILSGILAELDIPDTGAILAAFEEKNAHELAALCARMALSEETASLLDALCRLSGPADPALETLLALPLPESSRRAALELSDICRLLTAFGDYNVHLDLSVLNDMDYYNGLIFRGFVDGIAVSVLSGGRYDRLLERMNKSGGAIGFAVYLDELSRFLAQDNDYDVDTLLVYTPEDDPTAVIAQARSLEEQGRTVRVQPAGETNVTYRKKIDARGKEIL